MIKNIFRISLLSLMFFCTASSFSQDAAPTITFYSIDEESTVEMNPGDSQSTQAPCELEMNGNLTDYTGWNYNCEWRIFRAEEGESKPLIARFDEQTKYTLTEAGAYGIKFYSTFTNAKGETIEYESETFSISISESQLSCPDGFSPNGDGINDIFTITYKSIVKLQAYIINRWGQRLYTMDLNNADKGWDGMIGGKPIKDGVYFLNLYAVGSDGIEYKIKKAINVLKGFRETGETDGGTGN